MPSPMKLEQERSTVTPTSTHTASVKAVITLFMLVLTFINPLLFIVPTALCGYSLSKSTPI